jgi:hypothetical protein
VYDFSELCYRAVFHKLVGQSHADDVRMIVVVAHPFYDGRAEAAHAHAVLDGYDAVESASYLVEQFLVERFQESHVVVGHAQSLRLFLHFGYGLGSIVSDIIGVPGALVGMVGKSAKAAKEGEIARAVEELSPVFVKNIMASYRIATTGAYTLAGKPINGPGEIGPRKFDKPDAARKAMGFQPLSVSKDQDRMDAMQRRQALLSDKKEQFANRARRAFTEQNWEALNAQARGIMKWNKEQIDRGRPDMVIKPDVIKNAIKGGIGRQLSPGEMFRLQAFEKNMGADKKE